MDVSDENCLLTILDMSNYLLLQFQLQVPGCIKYKGAKIQLLDLPGIIEGAKDGKGRGRQVSRIIDVSFGLIWVRNFSCISWIINKYNRVDRHISSFNSIKKQLNNLKIILITF